MRAGIGLGGKVISWVRIGSRNPLGSHALCRTGVLSLGAGLWNPRSGDETQAEMQSHFAE